MGKKNLTKIMWFGSDIGSNGEALAPPLAPDVMRHLEGLNRGELYICDNPADPAIFIRLNNGSVVAFRPNGGGGGSFSRNELISVLGISEWALKQSLAFSDMPSMYWADIAVSNEKSTTKVPTFGKVKIGQATISYDETNDVLISDKSFVSMKEVSAWGIGSTGGGGGVSGVDISIVDNLTSTSVTSALSANMGRVLAEMIEEKTFDLTSQAITDALGFMPYNSTNFTKSNIKSTLGISDWALGASKPSYSFSEITGTASFTQLPTMYWANVAVSNSSNEQTEPTFKSIKIGGGKISWNADGYFEFDNGVVSQSFISAFGVSASGSGEVVGASSIKYGSQIFNSVDGVIDISQINISGGVTSWNDLTDKPSWIGSTKPSYTAKEVGALPKYSSFSDFLEWKNDDEFGFSQWTPSTSNKPTDYGTSLNFKDSTSWYFRLAFSTGGRIYYYKGINTTTLAQVGTLAYISDIPTSMAWSAISGKPTTISGYGITNAITTGNIGSQSVASAAKLATARSLWGNSFDGSSNIGGSLIPIADNTHQIGTNNARWTLGYFGWVGGATNNSFNLGANNSTHMTFTTSGDVGIGTTTPSTKLHVYGITTTYAVSLRRTTYTSLSAAGWYKIGRMVYASVYGNGAIIYINRAYSVVNNESYVVSVNDTHDAKGAITQISGAANSRLIEKVAIVPHTSDVGGDVYIYYKGGSANSVSISAVGQIDLQTPTLTSITPKYSISLVDGASVYGNILATGEVTAYSDARLKTDIKDLDFRGALSPKSFIKDGKQSIGFIAQEVRELYPELVLGEETEDSYLSLNYGAITAVLACQTNDHEKRIAELERENRELKKKLNIN